MPSDRLALSCCILAVLCIVGGCGQRDRAMVSGTVTLDGKPLESGAINFIPAEGNLGPTAGGTISNGAFHVKAKKGVVPGKNRVTINSVQKTGRLIKSIGGLEVEYADVVPPRYNSKSELVVQILDDDNQLNFDLKGRVQVESLPRRYETVQGDELAPTVSLRGE